MMRNAGLGGVSIRWQVGEWLPSTHELVSSLFLECGEVLNVDSGPETFQIQCETQRGKNIGVLRNKQSISLETWNCAGALFQEGQSEAGLSFDKENDEA